MEIVPLYSKIWICIFRLYEAADIIQKLHLIGQELPEDEFSHARRSIEAKYMEIEKALIEEFVKCHRSDDKHKMAELALILSHFRSMTRGYSVHWEFRLVR